MSLLLKHDGRWIQPFSGWWSPTDFTKNSNQAIQSAVLAMTVFLPLFPFFPLYFTSRHKQLQAQLQ